MKYLKILGILFLSLLSINSIFSIHNDIEVINNQNIDNNIENILQDKEYQYIKKRIGIPIGEKILSKFKSKDKAIKYALYIKDRIESLKNNYSKDSKVRIYLSYIQYYLKYDFPNNNNFIPIKILYIVDGDTIKFENLINNKKYSLRMIGIDTPESNKTRRGYVECYGDEAKTNLKKIILRYKFFYIEKDNSQGDIDKYGRQLGYLIGVQKNKCNSANCAYSLVNVNGEQIRLGFAWEYTYLKYNPYIYQKKFKKYEKEAKLKNIGLWSKKTCNGERKSVDMIKDSTNTQLENIINSNSFKNNCSNLNKIYCSKLSKCEDAYFYLKECNLERLDKDKDGIPCESICR